MRNWRQLERHPLSAEYKNLRAKPSKRMVELVKTYGYLAERPITLFEGKVLEGWQRLQACIEADVEPVFVEKPDNWPLEVYVEAVNDVRRHESGEIMEKRAKERAKRIAQKRAEGMSTRQIAEEEEVSQTTVQRAIQEEGVEVEKVKGKDGRTQKANKSGEHPGSVKLCKRCKVAGKTKDCADCKALNKKKPGRPTYAWARFNMGYGTLLREISTVAKLYNIPLNSAAVNGFKDFLEKYQKDFKGWYASLTAQTPKG